MAVRRSTFAAAAVAAASLLGLVSLAPGATAAGAAISTTAPCGALPASSAPTTYAHVALIMFENKPLKKIVGNTTDAPYRNSLISGCSYS
jgi:hypothetical protein